MCAKICTEYAKYAPKNAQKYAIFPEPGHFGREGPLPGKSFHAILGHFGYISAIMGTQCFKRFPTTSSDEKRQFCVENVMPFEKLRKKIPFWCAFVHAINQTLPAMFPCNFQVVQCFCNFQVVYDIFGVKSFWILMRTTRLQEISWTILAYIAKRILIPLG